MIRNTLLTMERLLRKYRFLIIGCILRIISAVLSSEIYYYKIINYSVPNNFFQLILSLFILICDIFFLIDSILYYITIKDTVCLRINKKKYYYIILYNTFIALSLLMVIQLFIPLVWFATNLFVYPLIYTILILLIFFTCFFLKNDIHENIYITIIIVLVTLLKMLCF